MHQRLVGRELVTESQSVIEHPEADVHQFAVVLVAEFEQQLLVMVADALLLSPYRLPGLVELIERMVYDFETAVEHVRRQLVRLEYLAALVLQSLVLDGTAELETERARQHHLDAGPRELVHGCTVLVQIDRRIQLLIRRRQHDLVPGRDMRDPGRLGLAAGQERAGQGY